MWRLVCNVYKYQYAVDLKLMHYYIAIIFQPKGKNETKSLMMLALINISITLYLGFSYKILIGTAEYFLFDFIFIHIFLAN